MLIVVKLKTVKKLELFLWDGGFKTHGARCSSVVRAFAHGVMGRRNDPSWWIQ